MTLRHRLISILLLPALLAAKKAKIGGQAIIEGVMMRGKQKIGWSIRNYDGTIVTEKFPFISSTHKYKFLKLPVFRGAVNLVESFSLGYKALTRSAEIASEGERLAKNPEKQPDIVETKNNAFMDKVYTWISLIISLVISFVLFMYGPMWILSHLVPKESVVLFNTGAGIIRIGLFIGYIWLISMWKEIRRLFEYHGAEHKAIFTFEDTKDLTIENMRPYTTVHPRCGTSFLFLVGMICIFLFSIVDALVIKFIGPYPHVLARVLVHLALIPLVGGLSYEVLKLSDRYQHIWIVGMLIKPGLWLQKITTRQPDNSQLEVAATALKAVL